MIEYVKLTIENPWFIKTYNDSLFLLLFGMSHEIVATLLVLIVMGSHMDNIICASGPRRVEGRIRYCTYDINNNICSLSTTCR